MRVKRYQAVPFQQVDLDQGFWQDRQRINSDVTIWNVYKRFQETGRFDALSCDWREGMPNKPHVYWDSDVAKWMEAAAFILERKPDPQLEAAVDELVDRIADNQGADGYFNTYFTVCEPEARFTRRTDHELYCAGHLFEAAVAYARATGKEKFLGLMRRYADYIERVFKDEKSAAFVTPGHEEIELALVKLYRHTGEKRYLELSRWFVEERGRHEEGLYEMFPSKHAQDHLPVRRMETAEGHCVRALYLYSAMADLAYEYQDEEMLEACRRIFLNIVRRRMYVTGGVGSTAYGEAFTVDYDLPNQTAYAESCASIALIFFARRMLCLEADSLYADTMERVLYNGFLSGVSLDGRKFFYVNPLELIPQLLNPGQPQREDAVQRVEVFSCSCCPPNITRLMASVGDLLYTFDESTVYVHQYMSGLATLPMGEREVVIRQETAYPWEGHVRLEVSGLRGGRLALRLPGWCDKAALTLDGREAAYTLQGGYAVLTVEQDACVLELDMEMTARLVEASPLVRADAGKCCVQRGPVIYCAEAVDNGEGLWALELDEDVSAARLEYAEELGLNRLVVRGWRRQPEGDALYQPARQPVRTPCAIRLIPYFAFANRGVSEMAVWLHKRQG